MGLAAGAPRRDRREREAEAGGSAGAGRCVERSSTPRSAAAAVGRGSEGQRRRSLPPSFRGGTPPAREAAVEGAAWLVPSAGSRASPHLRVTPDYRSS